MITGRPTDYTEELAAEICSRLSEGTSLRKVCDAGDMPDKATIFRWLAKHKTFRDQYAQAKREGAEALAEEIIEIADDVPNVITGADRSDSARVQAQKLRIDSRRWTLSKILPKKYGDKLDLTSDGERLRESPIIVSDIKNRNADTEAEAKTSS